MPPADGRSRPPSAPRHRHRSFPHRRIFPDSVPGRRRPGPTDRRPGRQSRDTCSARRMRASGRGGTWRLELVRSERLRGLSRRRSHSRQRRCASSRDSCGCPERLSHAAGAIPLCVTVLCGRSSRRLCDAQDRFSHGPSSVSRGAGGRDFCRGLAGLRGRARRACRCSRRVPRLDLISPNSRSGSYREDR